MMNLHTPAFNPVSALLPIAAAQTALSATPTEPNPGQPSFAQLLQNKQAPAPLAAPAPPKAPNEASKHADAAAPAAQPTHPSHPSHPSHPDTPAHASAPAPARGTSAARDAAHEHSRGRAVAAHGAPSARGAKDPAESTDETTAATAALDPAAAAAPPADPALADWLAGLKLSTPVMPSPTVLPAPVLTPNAPTDGVCSSDTTDGRAGVAQLQAGTGPAVALTATDTPRLATAATAATAAGTTLASASTLTAQAPLTTGTPAAEVTSAASGPSPAKTVEPAAGTLSPLAESAVAPTLAVANPVPGNGNEAPTVPRGVARDGAEPGPLAALAAQGGGHGAQAGSGGSAGAGDSGHRGNATPGWTPLTPANTNPHGSSLGDMPIGLSALGPRADIRAAAPAAPAAPPVPLNLALPITSPEFSRAMGAQLAALAQGGVERVELHLNPAEMGPVSVQIAIEGAQARIDFGADVAATRQAIEAGLPELASALRDAGLTLTGGGVSQQSSRSRDDMAEAQARGQGRGQAGERGGSDVNETPAPPRRLVRAGGVDMYA